MTDLTEHPEAFCDRCGRSNIMPWFVDSDRWNQANGSPNGILCPVCFVELWNKATGLRATWKLVPSEIHWPQPEENET